MGFRQGYYSSTSLSQANLLRHAPPPQVSPTVSTLTQNTSDPKTFGPTEDVILVLPAGVRTRGVDVTGGRNIRVIGGSVRPETNAAGLRFKEVTGSVFVEGVDIDMSQVSNDAIACTSLGTYRPDFYLQNIRATGVNGANAGTHADLFQHQGNIGRLFVDNFTGRTNYQGFFIPSQFTIASADFRRVDLAYETGGDSVTYVFWFRDDASDKAYPVTLSQVYVQPRAGQTVAANAAWPNSAQANIGAIVLDDGTVRWPGTMRVSGLIHPGAPALGDFVKAGTVGLGYVSPGYEREAPVLPSGDDALGVCQSLDPWLINTVSALSGANRTHFMRLRGRKRGATKVRIGVGTSSGNISVAIYPNNGASGRDAAPAAPAKVIVASTAMSSLLQDDGSAIGSNTTVLVPLGTTIDVEEGDWVAISADNATATFSRANNPTHSAMLKGRMAVQSSAFPAPATPASLFQSTPYLYAAVE